MKPGMILLIGLFLACCQVRGQVSIQTGSNQPEPDPAAILDLQSTDKGFLPPRLTDLQIWQIADPPAGLMVFSTDSGKLVVYDGTNWHEIAPGACIPMPTPAQAGDNQLVTAGVTATLQANVPLIGTGYWTLISGAGGVIADTASPVSLFTGAPMADFTLRWTITTGCGASQDDVNISFLNFDSAVIVSMGGDDANPGTPGLPVRTIQQGILLAQANGKTAVDILEGTYAETVNLVSGVDLFGGFDSVTMAWHPATNVTTVVGGSKAVIGASVSGVLMNGISIQGANASGPGGTSYGVFLTNCAGIEIKGCTVVSGNGSSGTTGTNGTSGTGGYSGSQGWPGCENSTWPCGSCSQPQGGNGGNSTFGVAGGHGGAAGQGPAYGQAGYAGFGTGAGAGGQGGGVGQYFDLHGL